MSTIPTPRQRAVLSFISRSLAENGQPPSLREIAASLGISGTRAVEKHLAALEKKGLILRRTGPTRTARNIDLPHRPAGASVPIVGRVAAGAPILAEENIEGHLTLDSAAARKGTFLLKVQGDSMKEAGILDGDLVLVRQQPDAGHNDIVVALIDGEATVKRLVKEAGTVVLWPENSAYRPIEIRPGEACEIAGKVVGVFRF